MGLVRNPIEPWTSEFLLIAISHHVMPYRDNWEWLCKMMLNLFSSPLSVLILAVLNAGKNVLSQSKVRVGRGLPSIIMHWEMIVQLPPFAFSIIYFFKSSTRNSVEKSACLGKLEGWAKRVNFGWLVAWKDRSEFSRAWWDKSETTSFLIEAFHSIKVWDGKAHGCHMVALSWKAFLKNQVSMNMLDFKRWYFNYR